MIRSPLLRGLVLTAVLALPLTGCPRKTEGGLLLKLTVESAVRADCLVVDATSQGTRVSRSLVPRQAGKGEYFIGIARGDFPATLTWQATAYQGRCADETEWKVASRSDEKSQSFPASGVTQFELAVGQPDMTLDADRDTWVDRQKGGTDCNDSDPQVNPGVPQVCGSTVDTNCNGRLFCDDATCANEPACTRPATGLAFDMPPATVVAADCSGAVSLQSVAAGMPAAVSTDTTVTLAPTGSSATGLQLFSDPACTTPLTTSTLTLRFGVNRATFSFRAAAAGSLTVTASAMGLGSTAFTTTVTDRPVARLALNPVSLSAQAGACSTAVDVIAQDDRMMPTNAATNLPLAVTFQPVGTNTVRTYTDASCTTEGVPTIAAGTSTTRLYLRGTRATLPSMPITVEVSSPGVNMGMPATLAFTVTAGAPDHFEFVTTVLGLRNNECGMVPAEVDLFDVNGNLAVAGTGGVDVSLAVMPPGGGGTLQFFAASGCGGSPITTFNVPAGQSRAGVYLRAMGPGTYRVSATASALPVPMASLQVDVATMDPTALVFPSSATTIATTAGVCSPAVRLQTREMNSLTSPVSPVRALTTVTLSPSAAGFVNLFADSNCTTALASNQLTINAGSSEVSFFFRSNRAAGFTLSASATNLTTTAPPQPAQVNPGPTSKLVFDPPTTVAATAGACGPPLVLRSFDGFDNPTSATGPITPAASPVVTLPAGVGFSGAASCTPTSATVPMSDGGVTFFATAQRAQPYTLTATGISTSSTNTITFGVDAGVGTALRVITQPMAALQAGGCTQVTIERVDAFQNPVPGPALAFAVGVNGTGVLSVHGDSTACMSGTPGTALGFAAGDPRGSFFVRGRLVGTSTLTVTAMSHTPVTTAAVAVSAGSTETLRFATNHPPATSPVGACTTVTVERLDGEGNLSGLPSGLMVTATATGAGSMGGMLMAAGASCGSTAQTMATLTFTGAATSTSLSYSPRALGALNFVVSGTSLTSAMGSTTVGAGTVGRVAFVNPPMTTQPWGGCTALELEALDVGNNRVTTPTSVMLSSSVAGTFFTASDCSPGTTTSVTIPANGTITFGYRPQPVALGMTTVTATPPMPATAGTATFAIGAGAETALQRTTFPLSMTTADTCVDFTLRRVDGGGNATGGALRTVTITLSGAASVAPSEAQLFAGTGCTVTALMNPGGVDIAAMASTATFSVKVRKAGALTVSAASAPLTAPMDTTTTVTGGTLTTLAFSTTPPATLAANACSPAITVTGADTYGNPTAIGTQALSMANATFSSLSSCSDTIATLAAGTATSATFYLRNSTPGAAVTLTVGTTPSASQDWNIIVSTPTSLRWKPMAAPPATLNRFTCSAAFRVEVTDGVAPIQTPTARVLSFAPLASTGFRFFTDPTCTTEVTGAFQIDAMQTESPDLYAYALAGGTFNAIATDTSGSPLTATPPAAVVVSGGPAAALSVSPGTTDLLFKTCTAVTIRRQVGGADYTRYNTTVNVTVGGAPPAGSYTLHTMSDCSDVGASTLSGRVIADGSPTTLVYLKGLSADPTGSTATDSGSTARTMTVIATDTSSIFTSGTSAAISIHPAVRRGTCTIENGETSSATSANPCTIVPALPASARSRSFYTFQAVTQTGPNAPDSASAVCTIDANAAALVCQRSGTSQETRITFQVVTMGTGLQVNHFSGNAGGSTADVAVDITAAGLSGTSGAFLLFGYQNSGTTYSFDDGITAEFASATQVTLKASPMAAWSVTVNYALQVVQLSGVTVERGVTTSLTPTVAAPPANTTSVLLHTQRVANPSTPPANEAAICKYRLRGTLTSDTLLTFSRGVGTMGDCVNVALDGISYERLAVPNALAAVQEFAAVTITGNTTNSTSQNIGTQTHPLDRTWSFLGGQGPGGQSGGETNYNTDDVLGYTQARILYNQTASNTRIGLTRGAQGGGNNSTFGLFVLTFAQ